MDKKLKNVPANICVDVLIHLVCTLTGCLVVYLSKHNLKYVLVFLAGGILIDLDHFIDYYLFYKAPLVMGEFVNCTYLKSGRVYLFLHSWELNSILLALAFGFKSHGLFLLFVSMSMHLLIDNLQRRNLFAYFLLYRAYKRFDVHVLLPEQKGRLF